MFWKFGVLFPTRFPDVCGIFVVKEFLVWYLDMVEDGIPFSLPIQRMCNVFHSVIL
ncbi:hypothetical protein M3O96_12775 [Aquiflexum sp. TKW24L]|uniref:hypothetical protein n=1 Tax=Aquiflexum sp. TKW24L TaxID=2942212 RepID=UPI0020BEAF05|nr:hypothetical protein [Aquiflexum sp. TKW24L]MCL6259970.1 hypothetical protein [Aquiflexum sp. TKW24L]